MQAQLGWSRAALAAGAADVGLSPSSAGLLSRGEVELVEVRAPGGEVPPARPPPHNPPSLGMHQGLPAFLRTRHEGSGLGPTIRPELGPVPTLASCC